MFFKNKINLYFFISILVVYFFTRASDIYAIMQLYSDIAHKINLANLSFDKLFTGILWLNNNILHVSTMQNLNHNGNLESFLGSISGYGNLLSTTLCLIWVIYLTIKSEITIKSTQLLLLGYMTFAFLGDFLCYRVPALVNNVDIYFSSNVPILAGIFVLAHSCEIIRELTYSSETVTLMKVDVCILLLISISMILLSFQFNMPFAAYSVLLLLHIYSAFTVNKRQIYQARAVSYIKIAVIFYIFIDMATTVFYLNHSAMGIKLAAYLVDYTLYPFAHLLFIFSEYAKQETL